MGDRGSESNSFGGKVRFAEIRAKSGAILGKDNRDGQTQGLMTLASQKYVSEQFLESAREAKFLQHETRKNLWVCDLRVISSGNENESSLCLGFFSHFHRRKESLEVTKTKLG